MNVLIRKIMILLCGCISIIIANLIDSIVALVSLMYAYATMVVWVNAKNGAADPRVFPLAFMAVYFTFFPLRAYFFGSGNLPYDDEVLVTSLRLQFLAMVVFVTVSNLFLADRRQQFDNPFHSFKYRSAPSERLIFLCILPFIIYPVMVILSSGASSKREILDSLSTIKMLSDFALLILTVLVFIRAVRVGLLFYRDIAILLYMLFCVFYVLLTGERDILFKVLFGFLIIYYDQRKNFNFFKMIGIFAVLVFVVPISQYFKGVLLVGEVAFDRVGWDLILYSEFMSASRNFYSLLVFDVDQNISFLVSDVFRAFVPTMLVGDTNVQSTVAWFERVFRPENGFSGTSGWGFTIVGFGYMIGGFSGIVLIMVFYAWLLALLYNLRWKSLYWYAFYILALAAFVYVLRADLANLLSLLFKISGLCVLLVYGAHQLVCRKLY